MYALDLFMHAHTVFPKPNIFLDITTTVQPADTSWI